MNGKYSKEVIIKALDETADVLIKNGYLPIAMRAAKEYIEAQDERIKELEAREM